MAKTNQKILILLLLCSLLIPACVNQQPGGRQVEAPHLKQGFNLLKPQQDVELGLRSAQQVETQVSLIQDQQIANYVENLGKKLAAKAPGYQFNYQFKVVATKDINAFALPGGFIYVNAGAIIAANSEGELAGVIAHEISHVALRHGTNQLSKAYVAKVGIGILAGAAGRNTDLGQIIGALGGLGANMLFLKFSRGAERQADLEGAHIMADAGYDPRDLADFFKTLQAKGGQGVPEFLSDHPDPGNRVESINQLLPNLRVSTNPTHDSPEFDAVKQQLLATTLPAGKEPARVGPREPGDSGPGTAPPPPDINLKTYRSPDGLFSLSYPQNWDALEANSSNLIFAPKGAYGEIDGGIMVTHGMFVGSLSGKQQDLRQATASFVEEQLKANPDFRLVRQPQPIELAGEPGHATVISGQSPVTGKPEVDIIYTTLSHDGRLFYLTAIAPEAEIEKYQDSFQQILKSLQLNR